jgi:hypothetical protein
MSCRKAQQQDLYVNVCLRRSRGYFKYTSRRCGGHCDNILAVGDCVVVGIAVPVARFRLADIDLTYNGIPAYQISLAEKYQSRDKLRNYCLESARLETRFYLYPCNPAGPQ